MTQIINVAQTQIGEDSINTVNARELHAYLGVGKKFSDWIKDRIEMYSFEDGVDYITAESLSTPNLGSTKARPQKLVEYHVSLDMAKELSMVDRGIKGKEARKYFLECEKKAKAVVQSVPLIPTTYIEALEFLVASEKAKAIMAVELQVAAPKIEFYEAVSSGGLNELNYTLKEAANLLGTGRTRLSAWLQEKGYMTEKREPYQSVLTAGWMTVKIGVHKEYVGCGDYIEHVQYTPYVTGKGLAYFSKRVPESLKTV
jgi:anti-repressor protein